MQQENIIFPIWDKEKEGINPSSSYLFYKYLDNLCAVRGTNSISACFHHCE